MKKTRTDKQPAQLRLDNTAADLVEDSSFVPTKGDRQEFFIPVSGFIWLYPEEVEVVDHPAFQRLGKVYQLGQTFLVYRGGTHKRLEHSLGAAHVVQRMIDAVKHTHEKAIRRHDPTAAPLNDAESRFVRLGALLHDIGHVAAGHTLEDELCLLGKHDRDQRLDLIFDDPDSVWRDQKSRSLGDLIDERFSKYLPKSLGGVITPRLVTRLLLRKAPSDVLSDKFAVQQAALAASFDIRLNLCRDMIGNTICADILDYIYRDWYHVGKPRPSDDRIFQYMEIRPSESTALPTPEGRASGDMFVISLGKSPKIRTDAVSSILELLEWRYQLAETVLFHRTKLAGAAMLDRALYELWSSKKDDSVALEKFVLPLSDDELLSRSIDEALKLSKQDQEEHKERGEVAHKILTQLTKRQLFTNLCTLTYDDLPEDVQERIQARYGRDRTDENAAPRNRAIAMRLLEKDFGLEPGSVAMYCPTAEMNAKIAQVKIAVDDQVEIFSKYEEKHGRRLSGGHLDAQLKRFLRLWRVHFFISKSALELLHGKNSLLPKYLRDAVEKLVLGHLRAHDDPFEESLAIATNLSGLVGSTVYGKSISREVAFAAYRDENVVRDASYPSGLPSITGFFRSA